jgi:sensor c-di-GMP phosphodiesterase-like protein
MLWFTSWLQKQGEAEAMVAAHRAVQLADLRIDHASAVLASLAKRGIDSCKPAHIDVLHQTVFSAGPIKELALIGPNGETLCTDAGAPLTNRDTLASAATSNPETMLDVIRVGGLDERMLRVRRPSVGGKSNLAALLPASLLVPQLGTNHNGAGNYARLSLPDGTVVGSAGTEPTVIDDNHVLGQQRSERYGTVVNIVMPREGVIATYDDLRRIGMVVAGLCALSILLCALIIPLRHRHNPMSEIERALAAGEFIPYYQPIVDIKSGGLLGAEVLARWRKPDGTLIPPGAFIPLLESSGLIFDLTRSLMRQVCSEAGGAFANRPNMYLTFNVAPSHFGDSLVLNDVGSIFEGAPIRLSQIVLEVTERNEITNLAATRRVIAALQGLGCRVAIDDVGTGHSGLSYILKLGVDIIKIDKLFVEAIRTEPHSQAIVGTLVDLARNLRMQIVAEGVENFEQVVYLREHGISAAQGFVFAPPLPGSAFLQLVDAMSPLGAKAETGAQEGIDDMVLPLRTDAAA